MPEQQPRRKVGRPSLGRDLHRWNPRLEPALIDALVERAETAGIPRCPFADSVLAAAHEYTSRYHHEVSSYIPADLVELRAYAASGVEVVDADLSPGPCKVFPVRAEGPLARQISARARELGIPQASYVRAILRFAMGVGPQGRQPVQLELAVGRAS